MKQDYVATYEHLEERLAELGREIHLPMGGFARLHRKALADGALGGKVKELMALAVSIAVGGHQGVGRAGGTGQPYLGTAEGD